MKKLLLLIIIVAGVYFLVPKALHTTWPSLLSGNTASMASGTTATSTTEHVVMTTNTDGTRSVTLKVGQSATINGVAVKIVSVKQDSRCAAGTQCLSAGTVEVTVNAEYNGFNKTFTLELNKAYSLYGYSVTLSSVYPTPVKGTQISTNDYSFTFTFGKTPTPAQ